MNRDKEKNNQVHFRQVTERFCSQVGDNVVVMQTIYDDNSTCKCMSADGCPSCEKCKNNI